MGLRSNNFPGQSNTLNLCFLKIVFTLLKEQLKCIHYKGVLAEKLRSRWKSNFSLKTWRRKYYNGKKH